MPVWDPAPKSLQGRRPREAPVAAPRSPHTITRNANECQKNCRSPGLIHLLTMDILSRGNMTHMTSRRSQSSARGRSLLPLGNLMASRLGCCVDEFDQFGEFLAPLELGRSRGCRCAHASEKIRVAKEAPCGLDELCGIIRVGGDGKSLPLADGNDIAFGRSNGDDGLSRSENAIQLAGDDNALEATLYSDDVDVGGGQHGGDFAGGKEWKEANIGESGGSGLQALSLGAIADEDQVDTVLRKLPRGSEQRVPSPVEAEIARMQ